MSKGLRASGTMTSDSEWPAIESWPEDALPDGAWQEDACAKTYQRNRAKWERELPAGNSGVSWLIPAVNSEGQFQLRYWACSAYHSTVWAVSGKALLGNLRRHHKQRPPQNGDCWP